MQTEVAEAFERSASGDGGSSTTQHKRNPTAAAPALAAAAIAPQLVATILAAEVQEHERALGAWQAEWPTFTALALVTSGALAAVADIAQGLEVDPDRMRSNLDLTHGLIMAEPISFALAAKIGKPEAHEIVEEASRKAAAQRKSLQDVLAEDPRVTTHLPIPVLARLFEPNSHQGAAQTFIDRQVGRVNGNKRP
jgi:3-carboxy-cis,cis-muconate cycloisomerase